MRREVPTWLAVVIIVVVLIIVFGAYIWFGSPRRREGGMVTKPPATSIPSPETQQGKP
ncbi:MAG: hypothetical protein ACUVRR_12225 [Candidatus Fervidibacter sp.]|uniref:hypothetical protein n=1 Tax=Candidatus Fervidibacter sp. TaxID=3100871 RepID=UPI00404B5370